MRPLTRPRREVPVVAYLLPAVVGGGLGDIEEVLAAGRRLARAGVPLVLFRRPGRPLPPFVNGPFAWPPHRRVRRPVHPTAAALTLSAGWGIAAAPGRDEPYGRAGPWSEERAEIEAAHGPDRVLHVSFEEFARTLTSAAQGRERLREGGVPLREIRRRAGAAATGRETEGFRRAYRTFRAFDRPDVLHLFTSFGPSRAFAREFPEAVATGPLWPDRRPPPARRHRGRPGTPRRVLWYASPSSSARVVDAIVAGLGGVPGGVRFEIRSPHAMPARPAAGVRLVRLPPLAPRAWARRWDRADLAIVTGSRSLLEAIARGLPFLYFNGILGSGRSRRRHRPEKIDALLAAWRRAGALPGPLRDLADFARGRRVGPIVRRALTDARWRRGFPRGGPVWGFVPPFDDAGAVVLEAARRLALGGRAASARAVVAALRREARASGAASKV